MPQPGFIWVQGTELRYVDANGNVRAQTGTATGATGQPGYIWIQGNNIYYTDANGQVRYLPYQIIDNLGTQGFLWLEGTWIHYTRAGGGKTRWHSDVAHSDVAHSDVAHSDAHSDRGAYDDWSDNYSKYDAHTDYKDLGKWLHYSAHLDHSNVSWDESPHTDWGNHIDVPHRDVPHSDVPHTDQPALV